MTNSLSLHPWNAKFSWENATQRSGFLTQPQIDQYNNEGFLILEDAISKKRINDLTLVLDVLANETEGFLQTMEDSRLSIAESGAILFGIHPSLRFLKQKHSYHQSLLLPLLMTSLVLMYDSIGIKLSTNKHKSQGVSLGIKIMGMVSLNPSST